MLTLNRKVGETVIIEGTAIEIAIVKVQKRDRSAIFRIGARHNPTFQTLRLGKFFNFLVGAQSLKVGFSKFTTTKSVRLQIDAPQSCRLLRGEIASSDQKGGAKR